MNQALAAFALLSSVSFAAVPVLEIRVGEHGEESKIKRTTKCVIYSDNKNVDFDEVFKLNQAASGELLPEARRGEPKVPSFEVFGYKKDKVDLKSLAPAAASYSAYLLQEVSDKVKMRKGLEAQELIELAKDICELKP